MIPSIRARLLIDSRDRIGEGPTWDSKWRRLIWSDNHHGLINETVMTSGGAWIESRRWDVGRPIGAAIPRTAGGFVVVAGTVVLLLEESGALECFARIDIDPKQFRGNDAKCDAQGRLWVGTLDKDICRRESKEGLRMYFPRKGCRHGRAGLNGYLSLIFYSWISLTNASALIIQLDE